MQSPQNDKNTNGSYDCVIYSYEDRILNIINHHNYYPQKNIYATNVEKRFDVIILRNPFNVFASRMKHGTVSCSMSTYISGLNLSQLWITYANEFLSKTNHLENILVPINYDLWCASAEYREKIAGLLELKFTDEGFNDITSYGQGSSFDGTHYNSKANMMTTDSRWQAFANNPAYINLFTDKLITDLTLEIYQPDSELNQFISNIIQPNQKWFSSLIRKINITLLPGIIARMRDSQTVKFVYFSIFQPIRKLIVAKRP